MRNNTFITFLFLLILIAVRTGSASDASTFNETKVLAQNEAILDLSGNEAFVLRQSWWRGMLDPGKAKIIQVQLFKRNEYRFWYAVPDRQADIAIHVYDSDGNFVKSLKRDLDRKNVVATTIKPEKTGLYFLRISLSAEVETPQDWAVIYAYR